MNETDGDGGDTAADNRRGPTIAVASDDVQYCNRNFSRARHAVSDECLHKSNDVNLPGIRYGQAVIDRDRDDGIARSDDVPRLNCSQQRITASSSNKRRRSWEVDHVECIRAGFVDETLYTVLGVLMEVVVKVYSSIVCPHAGKRSGIAGLDILLVGARSVAGR